MLVRLQASAGLVASQLARPREPLRGPALGVRTGLVRRPRAGHVVSCDVGSTGLPGVLGLLVAALAMSVLPAGNAAPVVPCGAALAVPGTTVGGDVSTCLLNTSLLNTSSVLAVEQASTAWQLAQVDAALTHIDAVVGTFSSELDAVLKAVVAAQTKLDAQASAMACLTDCEPPANQ